MPHGEGQTVVELSGMDRIREINEQLRYVIIEPGVTQKQLADALSETPFMVPMTGSGEETSVVGNLQERGATVFFHRNDLVLGWEMVLGNGDTVRTGFWHFMDEKASLGLFHAPGVGADLNGLLRSQILVSPPPWRFGCFPNRTVLSYFLKWKKTAC
ncbi:MAG: FAD-binding oxidoreductase [Saprospiraceae bacterium]|nr:FAD-binding oxidoreductase [Saprospiraceae bacterium]